MIKMKIKKRLVSYILAIILTIFLFITIVLTTLNCTLLSTVNVKKKVASCNYYAETQKIIIDACQNYVVQSGFDSSIMNGVVNTYDVESDVNGLIDYIYEGKEYTVQSNMIRANLDNNIKAYIEQNNYTVDEENQKSIDEFENVIQEIYTRNIEYSADTVKQIAGVNKKVKRAVPIAMIVCAIITIILVVTIKDISNPAIGISMLSTGAILVFLKLFSGTSVAINNILLMNKVFSNTLITIANNAIQKLFVIGIILCVSGLIWIVYFEAKRKIVKLLLLDEHSQVIR